MVAVGMKVRRNAELMAEFQIDPAQPVYRESLDDD